MRKVGFIITILFFITILSLPIFVFSHGTDGIVTCGHRVDGEIKDCNFEELIHSTDHLIDRLLFLAVPVAAIAFAWAGVLYFTSAGDSGKVDRAHAIFKNVAIGLAVAFAAWLIVNVILRGLGVSEGIDLLAFVYSAGMLI